MSSNAERPFLTVESSTGTRHDYAVTFGVARTLCGRTVPKARGWFGPVSHETTCVRCISRRPRLLGGAE